MPPQLKNYPQIRKLALDLGLKLTANPVDDILRYCEGKVKNFLKEFPDCNTLPGMLDVLAAKAGTIFETIKTEGEFQSVKKKYLDRGEKIFVRLEEDLEPSEGEVYGITFKRTSRQLWEYPFVSVIDCRGQKASRAYFTKWHEIAHLLVLTDQMRLSFRRTEAHTANNDPEEILPEASLLSSQINFVKAWPQPCLLVRGERAVKRQQRSDGGKIQFPELRAVHIAYSAGAKELGITIFENMRIPKRSVIYRVFTDKIEYDEAEENLMWWETSDGTRLIDCPVRIQAKYIRDSVDALIIPV